MPDTLKLNIGCGLNAIPGFVNLDNSPSVFLARHRWLKSALYRMGLLSERHYLAPWPTNIVWRDASKGLPFASGSAEKIYSSHFLEHIPYGRAVKVLEECRRVLASGKVFRLVVPDLLYHARLYVQRTGELETQQKAGREAHDAFLYTVCGKYVQRKRSAHCYMYDWPTLQVLLPELGFREVRRCEFRQSKDAELGELDTRPEDSLIVEMTA